MARLRSAAAGPRFAFGVGLAVSVPSRELGRPELREVFGVVLSRNTATTISTSMNRAFDQREGVRACLAVLLDGLELGPAVVELRAATKRWLIRAITRPRRP